MHPPHTIASDPCLLDRCPLLIDPAPRPQTPRGFFSPHFGSMPDVLMAANGDGAGHVCGKDWVLPLSRPIGPPPSEVRQSLHLACGSNQSAWPILTTTCEELAVMAMGIKKMIVAAAAVREWIVVLAPAMLAMPLRQGPGGEGTMLFHFAPLGGASR